MHVLVLILGELVLEPKTLLNNLIPCALHLENHLEKLGLSFAYILPFRIIFVCIVFIEKSFYQIKQAFVLKVFKYV